MSQPVEQLAPRPSRGDVVEEIARRIVHGRASMTHIEMLPEEL